MTIALVENISDNGLDRCAVVITCLPCIMSLNHFWNIVCLYLFER